MRTPVGSLIGSIAPRACAALWSRQTSPAAPAGGDARWRSRSRIPRGRGWAAIVCSVGCLTGCDQGASPDATPAPSAPSVSAPFESPRIVSLSPAISRTLVELGGSDRIVGRTPFCDALEPGIPVVGSLLEIDYERLLAARPTHLLVQPPASGIDPELPRLAAERGWVLRSWRLDRLEDVERLLRELPEALAGGRSNEEGNSFRRRSLERAEAIASLRALRAGPDAPRVLLLVSVEPPVAAGRETFVSEVLEAAGYRNAADTAGYPECSLERIVILDPDAIVVLREREPDAAEGARIRTQLTAIPRSPDRDDRRGIDIFADPDVLLPSAAAPRVTAALRESIARALHGAAPGPQP